MKKQLSPKEKLFCTYYCINRNGREAAAKSGYRFAERTAAKLLGRRDIIAQIEKTDNEAKNRRADIIAGYYRLAFGCVSDAVRLLLEDEIDKSKLEEMDLFLVSDIKKPKGGGLEIKFFDRLKALDKLDELVSRSGDSASGSLYSAIERGAEAIRREADEQ